jgi:hypothetical protein
MLYLRTASLLAALTLVNALVAPNYRNELGEKLDPEVKAALDATDRENMAKSPAVSVLSAAQVAAFKPYTYFAAASACQPANTLAWNCGANCNANPGFLPTASGGNGDSVQFWYVGYDPSLQTVIVGHQGTDTSKLLPILTDANFFLRSLSTSLFPGISSSVKVHDGFADAQEKTAASILSAVKTTIATHSATTVTVVGHSLGAAISHLDTLYLRLQLPASVKVQFKGYGMPRVGNQEFADYMDSRFSGLMTHVHNLRDPVPILPGRFLGFHHDSGEIHISPGNVWNDCPGQDNTSKSCTVGAVPNIFDSDADDHSGPYDGVHMGC